jgi:hypothetical protein
MSTQSWKVSYDGPTREIVADTDPQTGRVSIRVDGRMATRPMAADEDERTFNVGSVTYILRRTPGELDLDIAPPEMQVQPAAPAAQRKTSAAAAAPAARKQKPVPVFRIVSGILLTLVIGASVRYGRHVLTYMRVPWRSYTHPDRAFRVNFAGVPQQSANSVATLAGVLRTVQLKSQYQRHFYVVEFIDLPEAPTMDQENQLTTDAFNAIVKGEKWNVLKKDWGNRGLDFLAEVPESKDTSRGTARGSVIVRHARIYVVYAFVPRGESLSWDTGEFLRSLELAE